MNEIEYCKIFTHVWQVKSVLAGGTLATVTGPRGSLKTTRLIFAKKSDRAWAARRGLTCKVATRHTFQRSRGGGLRSPGASGVQERMEGKGRDDIYQMRIVAV